MSLQDAARTGGPARCRSRLLSNSRLESFQLLLLGIALAAAVPRLYLGTTQFVEYDGYWSVFIAQQDHLRNFVYDYRSNAHPPLYYVLLRMMLWFGRSPLVYRAVSLLTGVAAIYILGLIASKLMRSRLVAALAALAYGLALPSIIISCEVRHYMLCVFFVLISYYFFLDLIGVEKPDASVAHRIAFAASAILACLTHYCAVFYVAGVLIVAVVFVLLRRWEPLYRSLTREAATFAPVLGVTCFEYIRHLGPGGKSWNHLLSFYYLKNGPETMRAFLFRNLQNTFNLFSPWPVQSRLAFLAILAGLLLAAGLILYVVRHIDQPKNLPALATVLVPVLILDEIMLASLLRAYPFGGFMRQQFVLFPFLVLCAFLLPDRLAAAVPHRAASVMAGVLAVAVIALSIRSFVAYPKVRRTLGTPQMEHYNRLFPGPGAVYVDQFNLVMFFIHHDNWKWKFAGPVRLTQDVDTYRLSRGGSQMLLFRDKDHWILDFSDPALYRNLAGCLRSRGLSSVRVFCVSQQGGSVRKAAAELADFRKHSADLSRSSGLCVQILDTIGYDVYAEFRAGGCTQAQPGPEVDDTDPSIVYTGAWQSGTYPGSMHDTLTFTNQLGATAFFSFHGTGITYVYTKAFNRGRARVSIDGSERAILDLYDPKIVWRSSTDFKGLPSGDHTIEITVLNSRNSASQDTVVDVDALIPH